MKTELKTGTLRRDASSDIKQEYRRAALHAIGAVDEELALIVRLPDLDTTLRATVARQPLTLGRKGLEKLMYGTEIIEQQYLEAQGYRRRGAYEHESPHLPHIEPAVVRYLIEGTGRDIVLPAHREAAKRAKQRIDALSLRTLEDALSRTREVGDAGRGSRDVLTSFLAYLGE